MLLPSLTVSLDILKKEASTIHIEDVINALGQYGSDIDMFRTRVKKAEHRHFIALKLIKSFRNDQLL